MPIHDWSSAPGGYFHHFHQNWAVGICAALNAGLLPKGVFALVEQHAGAIVPDVLALETGSLDWPSNGGGGGVALAIEPPKTRFTSRNTEQAAYVAKANRVAVHRRDQTVAVIEIVSPGNKSSVLALQQFVDKSVELMERGIHLLVVDLFPPTPRDPNGIHGAIWDRVGEFPFTLPAEHPLTLASYVSAPNKTAYVEAVAVGDTLPEMPVFLDTKTYVRVPLGPTYESTWNGCPEEFRDRVVGKQSAEEDGVGRGTSKFGGRPTGG